MVDRIGKIYLQPIQALFDAFTLYKNWALINLTIKSWTKFYSVIHG